MIRFKFVEVKYVLHSLLVPTNVSVVGNDPIHLIALISALW
jgi:hypothetical protein